MLFSGITDAYIGIQITGSGSNYTLTADDNDPPNRELIDSLWDVKEPNDVRTYARTRGCFTTLGELLKSTFLI